MWLLEHQLCSLVLARIILRWDIQRTGIKPVFSGAQNISVGSRSGGNLTSGSTNVSIGYSALYSLSTGTANIAIGKNAGYTTTIANAVTTGSNNIFIGENSGPGTTSQLTNSIAIGYGSLVTASNSMVLGNSSVSVGINTSAPSEKLEVVGNVKATSFISTSDRRLKKNIFPVSGKEIIEQLSGVSWQWKADEQTDAGVIAQDVEKVMPYAVITDAKTGFKAVKYNALIAPLIEATKDLYGLCEDSKIKISSQEREIASLRSENQGLHSDIQSLQNRLELIEAKLRRIEP